MGKLIVLKDSPDGGVEVKYRLGEQGEQIMVPRSQPTSLTSDGCSATLGLRRGDVFALSNGEIQLYFVWNGLHKTTLEGVANLYSYHAVPMPFSVGERLGDKDWMYI